MLSITDKHCTLLKKSYSSWNAQISTGCNQSAACRFEYRITCKYLNAFQYWELCRVAIRYPMPDPKEGLQSPCSFRHQNIILAHAVVLDHDLKHRWKKWFFECLAAIRYSHSVKAFKCIAQGLKLSSHDLRLELQDDWILSSDVF